jgi:hypothetical protein
MIKIIFLCNWGESSSQLLARYSNQTPNKYGEWKDIVGVTSMGEADFFIVLEGSNVQIPIDKIIFIKREPNFIRTYQTNYKYVIDWDDSNCGITWWVNKSYDEFKSMTYPDKTKKVSCVVSSKHKHRAEYVKSLFRGKSPIDLYGRGHNKALYGDNYKGPLEYDGKCKLRGLIDYEYSVVLENSQQKNYFTEKLADAILSWTVPLYWGCPNIIDLLPKNSYHLVNTNIDNPIGEINKLINNPIDVESLGKARDLILDEYNIWEVISKKIKTINNEIL